MIIDRGDISAGLLADITDGGVAESVFRKNFPGCAEQPKTRVIVRSWK